MNSRGQETPDTHQASDSGGQANPAPRRSAPGGGPCTGPARVQHMEFSAFNAQTADQNGRITRGRDHGHEDRAFSSSPIRRRAAVLIKEALRLGMALGPNRIGPGRLFPARSAPDRRD